MAQNDYRLNLIRISSGFRHHKKSKREAIMSAEKIALVTGAGTGIGRASALALMKAGFTVVLAGRRKDKLDEVAAEGKAAGGKSLAVSADMTSVESVAALFKTVKDTYGRLDVLFNNAGMSVKRASIEDVDIEEWKRVVDTNLTGPLLCTREAFRIMKDQTPQGGRIINNGSISAQVPRPHAVGYTATKHAITGLTKAAALDGRAYDIAVGQIDIGNAQTELSAKLIAGTPQAAARAAEPRMDVKDVADAVVYMANLPLGANVLFMTVMATKMPFVGRG
jgi:NADP-dependent 3-hydroxy acid dehydrogenase YdfG